MADVNYDPEVLIVLVGTNPTPTGRFPWVLAPQRGPHACPRIIPRPHTKGVILLFWRYYPTYHDCTCRNYLFIVCYFSCLETTRANENSHSPPKGSLREGEKQQRREAQPQRAPAGPRRGRGHEPDQPRHRQRAHRQVRPDPESVPLYLHFDLRELTDQRRIVSGGEAGGGRGGRRW